MQGLADVQARHECEKRTTPILWAGELATPGNENDGGATGRGRQWDFATADANFATEKGKGFSTFSMTEVARSLRCPNGSEAKRGVRQTKQKQAQSFRPRGNRFGRDQIKKMNRWNRWPALYPISQINLQDTFVRSIKVPPLKDDRRCSPDSNRWFRDSTARSIPFVVFPPSVIFGPEKTSRPDWAAIVRLCAVVRMMA